ncbi:MAG: tRNA(Ile)-lysidine synthase [Candidatus Azotimanducaceae bacterium]|jgi:tRNA(Ile)-lysidine synthase
MRPAEIYTHLWVGFSGGVDSTALLHMSHRWCLEQNMPITALHANHGLHPQSDSWQSHCEAVCQKMGITVLSAHLKLGEGNLEAQARQARYAFFREHVQTGQGIVLAHHAQDQSETLLLRLLQGRGFQGMSNNGQSEGVSVVRPLLDESKDQLTAYADRHSIPWIEDPSNLDLSLDRNYLRHEILPRLYARWPDLDRRFDRVGRYVKNIEALLAKQWAAGLPETGRVLAIKELTQVPEQGVIVLRVFAQQLGCYDITDKALGEFITQCERGDRARLRLNTHELVVQRDDICIEVVKNR